MKTLISSILLLLSFSVLADDWYWDNYRAERQNQEILRNQRDMQMQMQYNQNMQNRYQYRQNQESRREREANEQRERDDASGFYQ